jgi:hypothetical protein
VIGESVTSSAKASTSPVAQVMISVRVSISAG